MNTSIIFFRNRSQHNFTFMPWDCCERLGDTFQTKVGNVMYVGIPKVEIDEFFLDNANITAYLDLITRTFDINYRLATEEEIANIKETIVESGGAKYEKVNLIVIRVEIPGRVSNKYFNVAYNYMRYMWYRHYSNMAIIATNLYRLHVIEDTMDIFAIASSYQTTNNRAVLPQPTDTLPGLLFFRPKKDVIPELQNNTNFNTIFYKYPIYFDPIVKISGSFFTESSIEIKAKENINKLVGVTNVEDIPEVSIKSLRTIYDDYLLMRDFYLTIIANLNVNRYQMRNTLLLSKAMKSFGIGVTSPDGRNTKVRFEVPWLEKVSVFSEELTF